MTKKSKKKCKQIRMWRTNHHRPSITYYQVWKMLLPFPNGEMKVNLTIKMTVITRKVSILKLNLTLQTILNCIQLKKNVNIKLERILKPYMEAMWIRMGTSPK